MMFKKVLYNIISIIVLATLFVGCATKRHVEYVDREVIKYKTKIQHDTIINNIRDSVYHTIFQRGDTIFDTKYVERFKYRDKIVYRIDTCYRDSIRTQIKENTIEKYKTPTWCYYCLILCIIFIAIIIYKIIRWLQTR
jgi:hypothetical protein